MSSGILAQVLEGQHLSEEPEYEVFIEHCLFSWTIENFGYEEWNANEYLCSPKFSMRSSLFSTWCVKLKRCVFENGFDGIELLLHRFEHIYGASMACVTCRFGLENSVGNKVWLQEVRNAVFGKPDTRVVRTSLLEQLEDFCGGSLTVLLEMYASSTKEDTSNACPQNGGFINLLNLSLDMTKMYANQTMSNVLLQVFDRAYRVHKSVLSARSPVIARMLEDGNAYIELPALHSGIMDSLLYYIYSGSISLTLANSDARIGLYETAYSLGISDLTKLLVPNLITAKTSLGIDHCNLIWFIEHFSLRSQNVIVSPEFSATANRWRIILYNHGSSSIGTHIGVIIKPHQHRGNIQISLEVSLLDKNEKPWFTQNSREVISPGNHCMFPFFVEKSTLTDDLLPCDTLSLRCKLSFVSAKSEVTSSSFAIWTTSGELSNLQRLSNDLSALWISGYLSDWDLLVQDKTFSTHKDILAARSQISTDRVQCLKSLKLSEVDPDGLHILLTYIYTGVLKTLTPEIAMAVYRAARQFGMSFLKRECLLHLEGALEVPTVLDVYCFARHFDETSLKLKCVEYIYYHSDKVFENEEWRNWEDYNADLAKEIYCSLKVFCD